MNITIAGRTELDLALAAARSPGDSIRLEPGEYVTDGNWAFPGGISLAPGVMLDARGSVIRFSANPALSFGAVRRVARDLNILWAGANAGISGGTFDCTPPQGWHGGGIRFFGRFRLVDTTITGLRGSWQFAWEDKGVQIRGVEVFGVSAEGQTEGSFLNDVTIRDVASSSYVSGIYMGGTLEPAEDVPNIVRECSVDLGRDNQFAFSASYRTEFTRCHGRGSRYGLYTDTGPMIAVLQECSLDSEYAAISSVGVSDQTRLVWAKGCDLAGTRGVEWWEKHPLMVGGVALTECRINSRYTATVASSMGAISLVSCKLAQPLNLVVAPGSPKPMVMQ